MDDSSREKRPVSLSAIMVSGIIALASSIFLLVYDKNLMNHAMLHWYGLIAYVIIIVILLGLSAGRSKGAFVGLIIIPVVFIVLILADAALNLPLSSFHSTSPSMLGWRYLFGFGAAGEGSTAIRSSALVIDLVASAVLIGASVRALMKK
ncbi:hypothetical protein IX51_11085 [uncultured archaeon]|nr:hypothetical protein IX51_11085 [uncultured archaeon]